MPKRDDILLIEDMVDCCTNIYDYIGDLHFDNFIKDRKTIDAVTRNFEILGEAASITSEELRYNNVHIEWKKIKEFRNVLIHEYFGVDYEIMWRIIKFQLPNQFDFLQQLLETLKSKTEDK
jgi:uncharacterized protein with HEPN domain